MDESEEKKVIHSILKGEKQDFGRLLDVYKSPIFNLACRMTGDTVEAEDLTQEIFIRAYLNLDKFNPEKSFFTWLYTIGLNVIRNHLKKVARRHRDEFQNVLVNAQLNEAGNQQIHPELSETDSILLERALLRLSADLREVIVLRYYQGLSFEEIAKITGKSLSALKMRTYRGLEKLKRMVNP